MAKNKNEIGKSDSYKIPPFEDIKSLSFENKIFELRRKIRKYKKRISQDIDDLNVFLKKRII